PFDVPSAPCAAVDTVTSSTASSRGATIAKKPSSPLLPLLVLSCTFTPSSVMLMAVRGRPLMDACRLPTAVVTPGRRLTKSIALRLVIGSLTIWLAVLVCEIPHDCVWLTSDGG